MLTNSSYVIMGTSIKVFWENVYECCNASLSVVPILKGSVLGNEVALGVGGWSGEANGF